MRFYSWENMYLIQLRLFLFCMVRGSHHKIDALEWRNFFKKNDFMLLLLIILVMVKALVIHILLLQKKTYQAKRIFQDFVKNFWEIHIFAFSMSGQIALNILRDFSGIQSVSFFSPALYAKDFFDIPFGVDFTWALQEKWNWHRSNIMDILPKFTGKIFLFRPEYDHVIPDEVFDLYEKYSPKNRFEKYIFLNAPHTLAKYFNENPEKIHEIFEKIF